MAVSMTIMSLSRCAIQPLLQLMAHACQHKTLDRDSLITLQGVSFPFISSFDNDPRRRSVEDILILGTPKYKTQETYPNNIFTPNGRKVVFIKVVDQGK